MGFNAQYSSQGGYGLKKCYDSDEAIVDILFIHGLTGNRETTWTDRDTKVFWPADLLKNDVPEARILTFGYDADVVHFWSMASQNRVGNHAQNLLNALAQLRERTESNQRPIIFVAHSLGGLVVEDALFCSKNSAELHLRQLIECTVGIAFLGTPHCGSDLANWAKIFGSVANLIKTTNTSLLGTLKPESEVLARIQKDFHTMIRSRQDEGKTQIKISCFFEELPVRGVGHVVPMHSAIIPAYNSIGIRNNHMDMTKYYSAEDPGYLAVSTELWRWVRDIKMQGRPPGTPGNPDTAPFNRHASYSQWSPYRGQPMLALNGQVQMPPFGFQMRPEDLRMMQTLFQPPVVQGGNVISGNTISGGYVVQGNNINSDKNMADSWPSG